MVKLLKIIFFTSLISTLYAAGDKTIKSSKKNALTPEEQDELEYKKATDKLKKAISKLPIVGILDTGLDLNNAQLKGSIFLKNDQGNLNSDHSTHLACMINKINTRLNFISYNYLNDKDKTSGILNGLKFMIRSNVKYLLFPSSSFEFSKQEEALLKLASDKGMYIFVSAGNESKTITDKVKNYPCSLKIKNLFCIGNRAEYSNKGGSIVQYDDGREIESCGRNNTSVKMKGTSQSTALFLGEFSKFVIK